MLTELPNGMVVNPDYVVCIYATPQEQILETEYANLPSVKVELKTGTVIVASEHKTFEEALGNIPVIAGILST